MVKDVTECSGPVTTYLALMFLDASGSAELTLCTTLRTEG